MRFEILIKERVYRSLRELPAWLKGKMVFSKQVRSLRELLGMTQAQLARRGAQDPRLIRNLESESVDPRLSTLQKTAEGLECELLLRFIPKRSLKTMLKERALKKAEAIIRFSKGTAAMEGQEPKPFLVKFQIEELAKELMEKKPSLLWED